MDTVAFTDGVPKIDIPCEEGSMNSHLLKQAMLSLQKSRLRVANSRILGLHPGILESLQPSSNMSEQNKIHGPDLLRFFEDNCPDLQKKDLFEIIKWGKWRTYYRPSTVLQRQGEEACYIGIILQGKLSIFTEDEVTRSKTLTMHVEKGELVGSEDFSSKFRTARRTVTMPAYVDPSLVEEQGAGYMPPQVLSRTEDGTPTTEDDWPKMSMYIEYPVADAEDLANNENENTYMDSEQREDILERVREAKKNNSSKILVTTIPTVMFIWDIKDLKRLMLADPHVESALSHLLRSDISYKLHGANPDSLATRICGIHTQARGDQDVRMCNVNPE